MCEPSNLIPNLNEIIKEYVENKEEAIQEVQSGVVQEEETRTETEQEIEETKKERGELRKLELRRGKKKYVILFQRLCISFRGISCSTKISLTKGGLAS